MTEQKTPKADPKQNPAQAREIENAKATGLDPSVFGGK